jgi:hypothetical protein
MHEFNNLLHSLTLRLMIVERDLPPAHAEPMARLRAKSAEVAELVARYQARRRSNVTRRPVDLALLLTELAQEAGGRVAVTTSAVPPVWGDPQALRTLVHFLLSVAAAQPAGRPSATLAPEEGGWVRLRLEMAGHAPEHGVDYFKPRPAGPDALIGLELPACRSIVYRAGGRLHITALDGRVALLLDLPTTAV